ncbi:DUF4112 domain-containing protein [Jannaschia seohaensis]|uniref:Uncharacterized protein DUF4112 n=1 Tax=Jannaschia seohaensis TaxID=475081 RepID=A0A2Y9B2A4_9RHOB|nr:DUF4112 domain-containing protein [Jannaschia seohaensis]PWJ13255.1 uncharacterized protein DUF4112 [Jannaschia seohaensis]SSA50581.1 protein of unknown function [Jannaschia seohaensis]
MTQAEAVIPPSQEALARRLDRLDRLATSLDSRFGVPGIRFGLDVLLGLIPGIGDAAALGPAAYILLEAHRMGAPPRVTLRMAAHTALDWLVDSVPLLGDLLDIWLKSNQRNVALLREHFQIPPATEQRGPNSVS